MSVLKKPAPAHVLATAVHRLKIDLHLNNQTLGDIIGQHRNTVARCLQKDTLDPESKSGELALLLIRVYRSLFALNGGNKKAMCHWLNTYNYHIQDIPLEAMKHVTGLSRTVSYLDAMRGKL